MTEAQGIFVVFLHRAENYQFGYLVFRPSAMVPDVLDVSDQEPAMTRPRVEIIGSKS